MLTKTDLQAIDTLFIKRTDEVITKRLDEAITNRIDPMITKRLDEAITNRIDPMITKRVDKIVTTRIHQALTPISRKIDLLVSFFDKEITNLKKRITRIETHIHLPALSS